MGLEPREARDLSLLEMSVDVPSCRHPGSSAEGFTHRADTAQERLCQEFLLETLVMRSLSIFGLLYDLINHLDCSLLTSSARSRVSC